MCHLTLPLLCLVRSPQATTLTEPVWRQAQEAIGAAREAVAGTPLARLFPAEGDAPGGAKGS